jgi:hypothetical protein
MSGERRLGGPPRLLIQTASKFARDYYRAVASTLPTDTHVQRLTGAPERLLLRRVRREVARIERSTLK